MAAKLRARVTFEFMEDILPEEFFINDDGRHVVAVACTLISFYIESAGALTSEERLFVRQVTVPRLRRSVSFALPTLLKEDWTVRHGLASAGIPTERIISDYPALNREKVELAAVFAEANPPRGRPLGRRELPKGAVVVSDRRVSRRKKA